MSDVVLVNRYSAVRSLPEARVPCQALAGQCRNPGGNVVRVAEEVVVAV
jgi:hypothetical protein